MCAVTLGYDTIPVPVLPVGPFVVSAFVVRQGQDLDAFHSTYLVGHVIATCIPRLGIQTNPIWNVLEDAGDVARFRHPALLVHPISARPLTLVCSLSHTAVVARAELC